MKKSLLTAAGAVAAIALALTGCSGTSDSASSSGPVHLVYWSGFTGGDSASYKKAIKAFNDSHPNIKVDFQLQPWDTIAQKLPTAISSGSGPDIATPDYNVATVLQYANNGLAL